jgi:ABC-type multidrug transport system permease subunit
MTTASTRFTWVAVAVAAAAVIAVIAVVASFLGQIGDTGMSLAGWMAMILGILVTVGLGVGLMSLVFISSRRGYDEPGPPEQ